jgi:hypothetical protein
MSQSPDEPFASGSGAYPTAYPPVEGVGSGLYGAPVTMPVIAPVTAPMTAPGVVPLRPLQVGELLDGAATALRAHPGIMLGLSAIVVAAGQLLAVPLDYLYLRYLTGQVDGSTTTGGSTAIIELAGFRPSTLIDLLTMSLLIGLLITTVSRAVLGRPAPLGEVWASTRRKLPRLLGLAAVVYLVCLGSVSLAVAPGLALVAGGEPAGGVLVFFGVVGGGVFALYRAISWLLAPAALVLEDQPIRKALKRSSVLVKGAWWRTFGVLLLAVVVAELIAAVLAIGEHQVLGSRLSPVTKYSDGTYAGHDVTLLSVFLSAAFTTAIQAVVSPFVAAVNALQYVDRRMRREALDIQLTRSSRGAGAAGQAVEQPRTAL